MAPRRIAVVASVAVLAVLAAALIAVFVLGGDSEGPGPGPSGSSGRPAGEAVSPFTGLPGRAGPVLAVKIDNVPPARPHTGLGAADIVYVERVEAGQTRLLAVYSSTVPRTAGPVRSARESDLELLRQFDRPALAYSGAQSKLIPLIEDAPLYPVPPGKAPSAYYREGSRPAPHNLYLRPARALAAAPGASTARDIGFRFGDAPGGGEPTTRRTVRFPAAGYTFTWSSGQDRWLVSMDGRPASTTDGKRLGAATVVEQQVTVRSSRFKDRSGSVSPYSETVGSGKAVVLRDGKAYDARWSRPDAASGTTFTTPSGERLNFATGPVWVLLTER